MRRVLDPRPLLAVVLLAGCTAQVPTIPTDDAQVSHRMELQASQDARPAVPIRGSCETEIQPAEPVGHGVIRQLDVGTCRISHLGLSTLISDKLINLVQGTQTADVTFIAANGDRLYATGSGTNSMTAPGQVAFQVELTFTGGTGRFSDATGMVVSEGVAELADARAHLTMSGIIRY